MDITNYALPTGKALVLRSCNPDMTSYGGFKWPEEGPVEAPTEWKKEWGEQPTQRDIKLCWDPEANCGGGLHGWLWANGDYSLKVQNIKAKYVVVEVDANGVIDLGGKVKFQKGLVLYAGSFKIAYDLVKKWFWLTQVKFVSKATSEEENISVFTKLVNKSASAAGKYGHASAAGDNGHASAAGDNGHASAAGYNGHASAAGKYGVAIVMGYAGRVTCGLEGSIVLAYHDGTRPRLKIGYAGENGIEAGKWYKLDDQFNFIETPKPAGY